MRKILLILALIFTMSLVGCSSKSDYKDVSVSSIQKAIESSNLLLEQPLSIDIIESDYFNDVDEKITEGFIIRSAINLRLEDIIVVKSDFENIDEIYNALSSYKDNMIIKSFGSGYGSEENANISSNTILDKKGNYAYLVSAKNAKEIEEVILNLIKK
ncbi:MAG: DUF4358 domain-containing protein [Romboutsia sp.]